MSLLYQSDDVPATKLIANWQAQGLAPATANGTVAAALHAACYLCDVAVRRGVIEAGGALGDDGLLHGLVHAAAGDVSVDLPALSRRAAELEERLSPGSSF